jgi:UDPglucose 6-dehydrogenase
MVKMKIGIIGRGTVGDAVYHGLAQVGNAMSHYDIKDGTCIKDIFDTEIVFICVPTDATPDGRCDVSIVDDAVQKLHEIKYPGIISIKSTVIPGTTDRLIKKFPDLNLCCVPEFLRQKSAHSDFFDNHDVLVIGTHNPAMSDKITRAHRLIPKSVSIMFPVEAEIVKYFNNVHNAMEIVFANTMYEMCTKLDADYQEVLSALAKRDNINAAYLKCSDFYKGYQGHCLPKDTMAWQVLAKDLEVDVLLFRSIVEDNQRYTK